MAAEGFTPSAVGQHWFYIPVSQSAAFLNAAENIAIVLELAKVSPDAARQRAMVVAKSAG